MKWDLRIRTFCCVLPLAASVAILCSRDADVVPKRDNNTIYSTGPGERKYVYLSDGSTVELASRSSILVSFTAQNRTLVLLTGRILLHVKHDDSSPFRVFSGRSVVQDVGTVFSVGRRGGLMEVLVAEGEVSIFDCASRLGFEDSQTANTTAWGHGRVMNFHHHERVEYPKSPARS